MVALCLGNESFPGERETRKTRGSYNMEEEGTVDMKAGQRQARIEVEIFLFEQTKFWL